MWPNPFGNGNSKQTILSFMVSTQVMKMDEMFDEMQQFSC
jgi:hypothetical protein